jgi:hypothetical protein
MPLVRILVHPTIAAETRRCSAPIPIRLCKGQAQYVLNLPAWARKSNEGN